MNEQETIADIIAEARDKYTVHECNQCSWRKCCSKGFGSEECGKFRESIFLRLGIEDGYFTQLLDRLDAAHKRERERGNAAKLREALKAIVGLCAGLMPTWDGAVGRIKDMAEAALAAPARNCDVGTVEEQSRRCFAFCNQYICKDCPCNTIGRCTLVWAQMPYEEGGAK